MKEINLLHGKVALVDDEDFEYLNQWKWYASKSLNVEYVRRTVWLGIVNGKKKWKQVQMHREIMKTPDGLYVDHINHNGLDNRKENLRNVTHRENMMNMRRVSKTGYIGVRKDKNVFEAHTYINGRVINLGRFDNPIDAHRAYMEAVNQII